MKVKNFFKVCAVLALVIVSQTACEKEVEYVPVTPSDTDSTYTDSSYTDGCDSTYFDDDYIYEDDSTGVDVDTLFLIMPSLKK